MSNYIILSYGGTTYFGNGILQSTTSISTDYACYVSGTVYAEGSTIKINYTGSSNLGIISNNNKIFNKVWMSGTSTGFYDISGSNTISELIIDPGRKVRFTAGTTQQIGKLTALGTLANPITISSITGATHTLNFTGTGNVVADYLNLSYSTATPANKWYASNSTNGGNNSGWTFANMPDVPTGLTPTSGNGQVSLAWIAPADNGTAIIDYVVEYKLTTEPTVWSVFADGTSTLTTATVTGLANRSSYDFRVSAVNAVGQGSASATATSTPADPLDRYWVGGTGNWSDTAHWSTSDGGTGGQAVPTSANNVYFSAGSFSSDGNAVILDVVANTNSLDFSTLDQTMTLTSTTNALNVYGSLSLSMKFTAVLAGSLYFKATTSVNITSNGNTTCRWNKITFNGVGGIWTNQDDWVFNANVVYLDNGTWNTNGKFINGGTSVDISYTTGYGYGTLNLDNSTLTINSIKLGPNNVLNAGTSNIIINKSTYSYLNYTIILDKAFTFNNITINFPSSYATVNNLDALNMNGSTINNFTYNGYSYPGSSLIMQSNFTVTNNLSLIGSNGTNNRLIVRSNTIGTQRTITVDPAKVTASNVDFRDIKFQNPVDLSNISGGSGDAGGNSGIIFTTAQPQYFKHTSGVVSWSDGTKWFSDLSPRTTLGRVPLPQDDVYFDASSFTGSSTLTVNVPRIGKSLDMSAVSQAVTMTLANNIESYGSHVLGNNITPSGNYQITLLGRGNYNLNTYSKTLYGINIFSSGGIYTNLSNIVLPYTTYLNQIYITYGGVFDLNDFDFTGFRFVMSSGACYLGNGTLDLRSWDGGWTFQVDNGTVYSEGSTIKFNPQSGISGPKFRGLGRTYNKVWFSGVNTGYYDFLDGNTISELIIDPGRKVRFTAGTTQQIGKLTAVGTLANPITISSVTGATHTLNYTGTGNVIASYLNLSYSTATPANRWYASNSTNGGNNSGWIFANVPDAPTAVGASGGNALANLTWSAPAYDGGTAITDYIIEYKLTSEPTIWSTFADGVSTNAFGTVTGLSNGSSYDFRISAVNAIGQGTASTTATATPITVPDAPTAVVVTRGNAQVSVAFTSPIFNGGSPITSYTVTSSPGSQTATGSATPIIVAGLTNGTEYTFTVTATNVAGTGPASTASSPVTPATIPDAPTTPIATAGNAQVSLSWTAPVWNGGTVVTDYAIEYKLSSESTVWSLFADGVSPTTTNIVNGLSNGLSYDFRIYSVNDVGQGSQSVETSAMPVTVPDAPTSVSGVAGNAEVTISFTPPLFDGGSTINNYIVTSSPGNFTASGNASPLTVTGLANGTAYTFTVVATNSVGNSLPSAPSASITPVTVPDAPTAVIASEGNSQATIAFTPPSFDGGTLITLYTATSTPGNFTGTSTSSPIIVTGLTNGTTYTFTVKATNIVGTSGESSPSNEVTLSTEPSQPVNLASTVLGSSIGLTWSAPVSNGGSAIVDYVIEYQLSTGGTWAVFAEGLNTATTATVVGLSNSTSYDFRVLAVNAIGQSIPSNTTTAIPGEPAQVIIQSFSDLTVPSVVANIRITNEGTSDYEYQYTWCLTQTAENLCGGGDDLWSSTAAKLINHGENYDVPLTSTMLVPGDYYFHIKVLYGSESSNAYQSFTALATYPDTPTSPTAVGGNREATVSFIPSAFNGGSLITTYTITSNPGGITGIGTTSPIVVTGLTNGIEYNFNVTATNIMGTSPASSYSNPVIPVNIPDAPTGITAIVGNQQVTLSWIAPVDYGGSVITDYIIEYKLTSATDWAIFSDGVSTATTSVVTGLTNNVSYDFRISTVNAVGQSDVNGASATLPKDRQIGSSGSSIIRISKQTEPTIPTEISDEEVIQETPITDNPVNPSKPTKLPIKKATNDKTDNNIIVSSPDMLPNEITVTPTENGTPERKNEGLSSVEKLIMIFGSIVVGIGGLSLMILILLRRARLATKIIKKELPFEIPTGLEPRRKI
jgi:hypothetical protein